MRNHDLVDVHEHTRRCWWNHEQARWSCDVPFVDAATQPVTTTCDAALVDVRDMIVVHTALLREFRLAPLAVRRTAAGDAAQAGLVSRHITFLFDLLHHHHAGEDDLLWPRLRERIAPAQVAVVADVEAQHAGIDAALGCARELLRGWRDHPSAAAGEQLAAALDLLHDQLSDHLELEEQALLPLAAALLTETEWRAVGEAAVAAMPKADLALTFGMFAYEGNPVVLRDMLASAPLPVRVLLPRIAPRLYARRARQVYGTPRP